MNRMNASWMTGIAAAVLALSSAGCGDKLLGISASILVTPDALAFGQGAVGVPQQIRVSVSNQGSAPLLVTKIWVDSDPNNELSIEDSLTTDCNDVPRSGSTTLSPGECARFSVTWSPMAPHDAAGEVEVDSSDTMNPAVKLPVTGNAASPLLQYCVLDANGNEVAAQCSDLGVNPPVLPTVDFGTGLPSTPATRVVRLKNLGQAALNFLPAPRIDQMDPNAAIFGVTGSVPGGSLAPGATADFTLTATPTMNGTITEHLDVSSNDMRSPTLAIPLQIFVAGWQLCVDPAAGLDFGTVTIGQSSTLSLTFTNCGSTDFVIDQFTFAGYAPTTNQFTLSSGTLPAGQTTFSVGSKIVLGVTYAPSAVQSDKASFDYQLAVGGNALMGSVPVVGKGAAAACGTSGAASPVANIVTAYATSAGGSYTTFDPTHTPSPVVPLDWVTLNGSTSTVAAGTPTYLWQLVSQPAGSTTVLTGANTVQAKMQTLVSGDYVVSLTVKDASSCIGTKSVTIHVVPTGDVHIELTWQENCADIDLHYVKPNSTQCTNTDCFYGDKNPNWNNGTGPKLDVDDLWGYGPENITQANPADGNGYGIWVYYYSSSPDGGGGSGSCGVVHPTVKVYFQGVLANTFTLTNGFSNNQLWHVANINVSNQASQFTVTAVTSGAGSPSNLGNSCE